MVFHQPRDNVTLLRQTCRIRSRLARNLISEFFGTILLLFTGFNVNAQTILSRSQINASVGMIFGWGFCLTFAVHMCYQTSVKPSGSHFNPAVSVLAWSFGQLPLLHVIWYSIAQTLGAFVAAAFTYVYYIDKINMFDGGIRSVVGANATAGIFATYPGDHLSFYGAIFDQVVSTAMLAVIIGVISDPRNGIPKWAHPSLYGAMLITISLGFGLNAGNAMNPARDIGPRVFTYLAGYGHEVFSTMNYMWFLIPVICPLVGALLGAWLYQLLIGIQHDDETNIKFAYTCICGGWRGKDSETTKPNNNNRSDLIISMNHTPFILMN